MQRGSCKGSLILIADPRQWSSQTDELLPLDERWRSLPSRGYTVFQRSPVYQIGTPDTYFTYLQGIVSQSLYELILLQYIILSSYYDLCLAHPFSSLPLTRQPVAIAFSMLPADVENLCSFLFFFSFFLCNCFLIHVRQMRLLESGGWTCGISLEFPYLLNRTGS